MLGLLLFLVFVLSVNSFFLNQKALSVRLKAVSTENPTGNDSESWQKDLDQILDIDTDCDIRRDLTLGLLGKLSDIVDDVGEAIRSRDVKRIAPPELGYGMAVEGLEAVQNQIISDIIPDIVSQGIPSLLEAGPKVAEELSKRTTDNKISDAVQDAVSFAQDPSRIQNTVDTLQTEVRNIFKSMPEGLQSPEYSVLSSTRDYEIRKYQGYSVCRTSVDDSEDVKAVNMMDPMVGGENFNELAGYIFGKNRENDELAMTVPVITQKNTMEFVLADGLTADTAPAPLSNKVSLADIPTQILAVRSFKGFATDGEVRRQREALEDALLADSIEFDNLSLKVAQYNPPYTLPWLRRNEVSLKVAITEPTFLEDDGESSDVSMIQDAQIVGDEEGKNISSLIDDETDDDQVFEVTPEAGD